MADRQTPQRLRSTPPELRIRLLIQILGGIWGFFLKLGPCENLGFALWCHVACVCAHVGNKERKALVAIRCIHIALHLVPATDGGVSQSSSINYSAYPHKKHPLGPPGAKAGQRQEHKRLGVSQQTRNTHSCTILWKTLHCACIIPSEGINGERQMYIFSSISGGTLSTSALQHSTTQHNTVQQYKHTQMQRYIKGCCREGSKHVMQTVYSESSGRPTAGWDAMRSALTHTLMHTLMHTCMHAHKTHSRTHTEREQSPCLTADCSDANVSSPLPHF